MAERVGHEEGARHNSRELERSLRIDETGSFRYVASVFAYLATLARTSRMSREMSLAAERLLRLTGENSDRRCEHANRVARVTG